jgi:hypothetical protein
VIINTDAKLTSRRWKRFIADSLSGARDRGSTNIIFFAGSQAELHDHHGIPKSQLPHVQCDASSANVGARYCHRMASAALHRTTAFDPLQSIDSAQSGRSPAE